MLALWHSRFLAQFKTFFIKDLSRGARVPTGLFPVALSLLFGTFA
jgi:hypothetical protein